MVNCNPETVSTDYDTSDRLYFEPLTPEDVLEIIDTERAKGTLHGVIVQFGGQMLKLAGAAGEGERADPRHLARRHRSGRGPRAVPETAAEAETAAAEERHCHLAGRGARHRRRDRLPGRDPSVYVLGGAAWNRARLRAARRYVARALASRSTGRASSSSRRSPLLIDRYCSDATEVDVDCLGDGKDTFIAGIMEHIEETGIHSGDSACALPPHSLSERRSRSWRGRRGPSRWRSRSAA